MLRSGRHLAIVLGFILALALPGTVGASHSWGGYHWARTSNPFTISLGDNVSGAWDASLVSASTDWTASSVLDAPIDTGRAKGKNCRPTTGRVEVCNRSYGNNGWLGVAQIWISGGTHITQGTVRVNDTYFNTAQYNRPAWRNFVMCQEVGHTFGLDHQDENFNNANLGTCMDYTNNPSSNQHPNNHDYEQLEAIYEHTDTTSTVGQATTGSGSDVADAGAWGQAVAASHANGRSSIYVRDLAAGSRVVTFVVWVL
jgi:hypothetical protein